MILFITANDETTRINKNLVEHSGINADILLKEKEATKKELLNKIALSTKKQIIFASHGEEDAIIDNNNEEISSGDMKGISDFKVLAYACNTARRLGKEMSLNGNIWWGFNASAGVFSKNERDEFKEFLNLVIEVYSSSTTQLEIEGAFKTIIAKCDEIDEILDKKYSLEETAYKDSGETRIALSLIKRNLEVRVPGILEALRPETGVNRSLGI